MKSPSHSYHKVLLAVCALLAAAAWVVWFGGGREKELPLLTAVFFEDLRVSIWRKGVGIGDIIEADLRSGDYLIVEWKPAATAPKVWREKPVQESERWTLELVMYPRDGSGSLGEKVKWPLQIPTMKFAAASELLPRFDAKGSKHWELPVERQAFPYYFRTSERYLGPLRCGEKEKPSNNKLWTFVTLGDDTSGEIVLELRLYPMVTWKSSIRYEMGEPIAVWRRTVSSIR